MHTRPRALRRCRACQHEFMVLQSNFKHTRNSSHTFHIGFRVKYRLGAPKEAWLIDALHAPTHERHGRTAGKPFRSMRKAAQLAALNAAASAWGFDRRISDSDARIRLAILLRSPRLGTSPQPDDASKRCSPGIEPGREPSQLGEPFPRSRDRTVAWNTMLKAG